MTLDPAFTNLYDSLAAAWRHHDDLRKSEVPISTLVASRTRLDALRVSAARMRRTGALSH